MVRLGNWPDPSLVTKPTQGGRANGQAVTRGQLEPAEGRLNLEEAFSDATFAAGKKEGLESALPSEAKGPRSRLSPLATVFLSPSVSRLLRRTKASSWKKPLATASSTNSRPD